MLIWVCKGEGCSSQAIYIAFAFSTFDRWCRKWRVMLHFFCSLPLHYPPYCSQSNKGSYFTRQLSHFCAALFTISQLFTTITTMGAELHIGYACVQFSADQFFGLPQPFAIKVWHPYLILHNSCFLPRPPPLQQKTLSLRSYKTTLIPRKTNPPFFKPSKYENLFPISPYRPPCRRQSRHIYQGSK